MVIILFVSSVVIFTSSVATVSGREARDTHDGAAVIEEIVVAESADESEEDRCAVVVVFLVVFDWMSEEADERDREDDEVSSCSSREGKEWDVRAFFWYPPGHN